MNHYCIEFVLEYSDGEEHYFDVEISTETEAEQVRPKFWQWLLPRPEDESVPVDWNNVVTIRIAQVQEHEPIPEPIFR